MRECLSSLTSLLPPSPIHILLEGGGWLAPSYLLPYLSSGLSPYVSTYMLPKIYVCLPWYLTSLTLSVKNLNHCLPYLFPLSLLILFPDLLHIHTIYYFSVYVCSAWHYTVKLPLTIYYTLLYCIYSILNSFSIFELWLTVPPAPSFIIMIL